MYDVSSDEQEPHEPTPLPSLLDDPFHPPPAASSNVPSSSAQFQSLGTTDTPDPRGSGLHTLPVPQPVGSHHSPAGQSEPSKKKKKRRRKRRGPKVTNPSDLPESQDPSKDQASDSSDDHPNVSEGKHPTEDEANNHSDIPEPGVNPQFSIPGSSTFTFAVNQPNTISNPPSRVKVNDQPTGMNTQSSFLNNSNFSFPVGQYDTMTYPPGQDEVDSTGINMQASVPNSSNLGFTVGQSSATTIPPNQDKIDDQLGEYDSEELINLKSQIEDLRNSLSDSQAEVAALKKQREEAAKAKLMFDESNGYFLQELETDLGNERKVVEDKTTTIENLQKSAKEADKRATSAEEAYDRQEAELTNLRTTIAQSEHAWNTQRDQTKQADKDLEKAKDALKAAESALEAYRRQADDKIKALRKIAEEAPPISVQTADGEKEIEKYLQELEAAKAVWEETTRGLEQDREELRYALEKKALKLSIAEVEIVRLQAEKDNDTINPHDNGTPRLGSSTLEKESRVNIVRNEETGVGAVEREPGVTERKNHAVMDDKPDEVVEAEPQIEVATATTSPTKSKILRWGSVGLLILAFLLTLIYTILQCQEAMEERRMWMTANTRAQRLPEEILRRQAIATLQAMPNWEKVGWLSPETMLKRSPHLLAPKFVTGATGAFG